MAPPPSLPNISYGPNRSPASGIMRQYHVHSSMQGVLQA
jgi:hypothetical protein